MEGQMGAPQKGGRERVEVRLDPSVAKELRLESVHSGEELGEIVEESIRRVLAERKLHRELSKAG
jgi:hypothetical protein